MCRPLVGGWHKVEQKDRGTGMDGGWGWEGG